MCVDACESKMKQEADAYCKEMNENAYLFNLKSFVSSAFEAQSLFTLSADINTRNEEMSGISSTTKLNI